MTDDLMSRLRNKYASPQDVAEAADRIEQLEDRFDRVCDQFLKEHKRIEKLGAALDDMSQYVSRADWHYLKNETRKALEEKDEK
jgi:hypothetical protein